MTEALANHDDAIDLLDADHIAVKALFAAYDRLRCRAAPAHQRRDLAAQICRELTVHAQIEEEIFYPEVREAIDGEGLLDEADVEHAIAENLIRQISAMSPDDDRYDAMVTVLGDYVDHHIDEEREQIFVRARKSRLDLVALADELSQRKMELLEIHPAEKA